MDDSLATLVKSFDVFLSWLRVHHIDRFDSSLYLLVVVILFWIWAALRPVIRIALSSSPSKR